MFSCENKPHNINKINHEKVYVDEDGLCVFFINDRFYSIWGMEEERFTLFPTDDSIILSQTDRVYYKQTLCYSDLQYDTIEIANSIELPRHRKDFLYNLRILDTKWEVAIYHPCTDIKGVYYFNIMESENKIFKEILNCIQKNAIKKYYPIKNNTFFSSQNPAPALYLKMQSGKEQSEYFGRDDVFNMLEQITTVILGNHILSDNKENKISDTIKLLDIRERFNFYVYKDSCTGFIIKDFDSLIPPPPAGRNVLITLQITL
jgi:hypothetical protein